MSNHHRQALVLAQSGQWDQAHEYIQQYTDPLACLIHGYLHLQEGDTGNAQYWYTKAKQNLPTHPLPQEFDRLSQMADES